MKQITLLLILFIANTTFAQGLKDVSIYTLDNGLTVILNPDHNKSEVFGYMVCKAGGKDDPADATGMAHYMEHMLFKGTSKLGTTNWQMEKPHIDSIFSLYEQLGKTSDENARTEIQKLINEQSVAANEYVIGNEFSNIVKKMGGTGLNANTSADRTVYFNTFPPNQIQPWLELYSHRFQDAVFRSFQSELETVYEEKNMYSDMFVMNMIEVFRKNFFKNHAYGQQTIIGTVDDLKNPSLNKMYEFYKTWYVPNNMALILSGDFNESEVKPMIDHAFASWQKQELPERKTWKEDPFNGREFVEVKMSPIKIGMLGFRTVPEGHPDELALSICNSLLTNESSSGFLDKLSIENKLMESSVLNMPYYDYGMTIMLFVPKIIGQKLEDAEQLIIDEIQRLKDGDFEAWRVDAVKKELYRSYNENLEDNQERGIILGETFARGDSFEELKQYPERIQSIGKEDVIAVAQKYYGDDFLAFYSRMGSNKGEKIEKPGYEPVIANVEAKSEFANYLETIKPASLEPKYIDFEKDVQTSQLDGGSTLYTTNNPCNDVFNLSIQFNTGSYTNQKIENAIYLMDQAYTEKHDKLAYKDAFAKLGSTYYIFNDGSYTYIDISGLDKNFDQTLQLINELLTSPKLDQKDVDNYVDDVKAMYKMEREDISNVGDAAFEWLRFGKQSSYINRSTYKEVKALEAEQLVADFKSATDYVARIHYSGTLPIESVKTSIAKNVSLTKTPKEGKGTVLRDLQHYNEDQIFFVNKKGASQCEIYQLANVDKIPMNDIAKQKAFNLYFGGGFSGLVLQEIREYRSLAYSAGAKIPEVPVKDHESIFYAYVGTQADKATDALNVLEDLTREMPQKTERIEMIKSYLQQSAMGEHPNFRGLSEYILECKEKGYNDDPAKVLQNDYQSLKFSDVNDFYTKNLKDAPIVTLVIGDKKKVDMKVLSEFGKITEIKQKDLYTK